MKCPHCDRGSFVLAHLTLDRGAVFRIRYCMRCERIQRIGDSVPDVKESYKGSFVRLHNPNKKGGDK